MDVKLITESEQPEIVTVIGNITEIPVSKVPLICKLCEVVVYVVEVSTVKV